MNIQITIIKIEGYGSWTLVLGSDREAKLQMLQAQIYHDLQYLFSKYNCLVFFNRFDEYFVITNTLSLEDHVSVIKEISIKHPSLCISFFNRKWKDSIRCKYPSLSGKKKWKNNRCRKRRYIF